MGEVYRAKDSNLKREIALKVLPAGVAQDRERLARFQREAEVLASLNHPHIAQIYGLEQAGNTVALVMELVEGEDLAQRIAVALFAAGAATAAVLLWRGRSSDAQAAIPPMAFGRLTTPAPSALDPAESAGRHQTEFLEKTSGDIHRSPPTFACR